MRITEHRDPRLRVPTHRSVDAGHLEAKLVYGCGSTAPAFWTRRIVPNASNTSAKGVSSSGESPSVSR
jgi:hypothetical protein